MKIMNRVRLLAPWLVPVSAILFLVACGTSAPSDQTPVDVATSETAAAAGSGSNAEARAGNVPPESVVAVTFTEDLMDPKTIRVKQGESVTLNLSSDRPGSFHIHGYDLQQEVVVGEVTPFQFLANATGRFGINFHGAPEPESGMAVVAAMKSGGDGTGDHNNHVGSMGHGPVEASAPVMLDITAEVDDKGGVHVAIQTEGWRWEPEEVNGANKDGAGHAHVYADGVKLSRVYGNYHYITDLEPGTREIKVSLNSNDHSELTWQGQLLESVVSVTVPEMASTDRHDKASMVEGVEARAPMSLEVVVHEDPLGGYNVQVVPHGFEFSRSLGQEHEPGKGYAQLSIDGEVFNRMYVPWLQAPAQGEGMHTFKVALLNDEGRPYEYNGQQVQDAAAGAATGHSHDGGSGHEHGTGQTAGIVELEVGYLEVLP